MGFEEIFSTNNQRPAAPPEGGADIEQFIFILQQQPRVKGELGDIKLFIERPAVEGLDIVQVHIDVRFLRQMEKDECVVRASGIGTV